MFDEALLISELNFKAIRSSGAGGQHVNKTSSKVELNFNLNDSIVFDEEQKAQAKHQKVQAEPDADLGQQGQLEQTLHESASGSFRV